MQFIHIKQDSFSTESPSIMIMCIFKQKEYFVSRSTLTFILQRQQTLFCLFNSFISLIWTFNPEAWLCVCVCAKSLQLCVTLCNLMDCSPPGSPVHGISQGRILEWVAIFFSRGSSQPRDWTLIFCTAGRFFSTEATWNPRNSIKYLRQEWLQEERRTRRKQGGG